MNNKESQEKDSDTEEGAVTDYSSEVPPETAVEREEVQSSDLQESTKKIRQND